MTFLSSCILKCIRTRTRDNSKNKDWTQPHHNYIFLMGLNFALSSSWNQFILLPFWTLAKLLCRIHFPIERNMPQWPFILPCHLCLLKAITQRAISDYHQTAAKIMLSPSLEFQDTELNPALEDLKDRPRCIITSLKNEYFWTENYMQINRLN